jgi:polyhydroxyalkanoic acid synthase PhaR subunit
MMSQSEREQEQGTPDPLSVWGAIYGANMEMWSRGIAEMINTEAVSSALGAYLDNYLASSEPFRRVPEQYLEFWLNSLNMPSRDDVSRLTERVIAMEDRIQVIDQAMAAPPTDQMEPKLAALTDSLEGRHSQMQTRIEEIQARIEAFDGRIGQIIQMIEGQSSHTEGIGQQLSQLTKKVETPPPPAEPAGLAEVQQRMQALESRLDQAIGLMQERASQPAASAEPATPAELETRVNALDEKAAQMLGLIQALHGTS